MELSRGYKLFLEALLRPSPQSEDESWRGCCSVLSGAKLQHKKNTVTTGARRFVVSQIPRGPTHEKKPAKWTQLDHLEQKAIKVNT